MWLNKIQGTIEVKYINNLDNVADIMVKLLQENRFFTGRKENSIKFRRSLRFTHNTGRNNRQILKYIYHGGIEFKETNGKFFNHFFIKINEQLFKILLLGMLIGLFLFLFEVKTNPVVFIGFLVGLILIQRALIYDHFSNIVSKMPQLVIEESDETLTY
jgi:hypothetical protein